MDDPNATLGDVYLYDASGSNVLNKLFRRQVAAAREFNKALAELRRLQKARREQEMLQALAQRPARPPAPFDASNPLSEEPWVRSESQARLL
jgi:hypothetical protein